MSMSKGMKKNWKWNVVPVEKKKQMLQLARKIWINKTVKSKEIVKKNERWLSLKLEKWMKPRRKKIKQMVYKLNEWRNGKIRSMVMTKWN